MRQCKSSILIVLLITILLVFGCDKHHAWGRIKIHHLPNNIEYIVGEKNSVDFSGMEISFYLLDGTLKEIRSIDDCICREYRSEIMQEDLFDEAGQLLINQLFIDASQVSYSNPGYYTIYIYYLGHNKPDDSFRVHVIDG